MTETRHEDSIAEVSENQETSGGKSSRRKPGPTKSGHNGKATRLLNLRQVQDEFGLTMYAVYKAVDEGKLHACQVDGEGRVYYAEWEVREILRQLFGRLRTAA